MGQDTPSWDDIPSLEELEIDWDFEPENPQGKRSYARLTAKELFFIFQTQEIQVRLVTEKSQATALLMDVSQGGVSLRTKAEHHKESQLVRMGFFLGDKKVISKGRIKSIRKEKDWVILGIEFVGLPEENNEYIASIYSSVKIKKS